MTNPIKFDSQGEERRYRYLEGLARGGVITGLKPHPHLSTYVNEAEIRGALEQLVDAVGGALGIAVDEALVRARKALRGKGRSIGKGWTADSTYIDEGKLIYEDYKPRAWRKMPAKYRHLFKSYDLVRALYPEITLRIVTPAKGGGYWSEEWGK